VANAWVPSQPGPACLTQLEGFCLRNDTWWSPSHSLSASKTAGSLLALLWDLLGTLEESVRVSRHELRVHASYELGFET
jgi:hypothetical protein